MPGATATRTDPAADILARLESSPLELVGRLIDASNATFVANAVTAGGPLRCIYKPMRGERPLDDFPDGTLANRERAAYLLSASIGWDIVPPTVLRGGPFGPGMVQLWVEQDPEADVLAMVAAADARLRRIAVFDVLANNADRKGGHLLPAAGGHVFGVDHGVCFSAEPKLRTVLWAWRGQPLATDELEIVGLVAGALAGSLGDDLGRLLSRGEVDAARARATALLEEGRFPQPDPRRPALPWPPF